MLVRTWTFGTKIALGFGLSVLILLIVGAVAYRSADVVVENDARVAQSHRVLEHLEQLLSLMKDAETGQRGFVITGDESFLEPYLDALGPIPATLADLRSLTADNPRHQQLLDQAEPFIEEKLSELKRTIVARRAEGFEVAQAMVQGGKGKRAMDDLRKVLGAMDREERDRIRTRTEVAESSAGSAKTTIGVGACLAVILVIVAGFVITRSLGLQLGTAVSSIRSSSAELQAAATQQASGSREQSSATNEVSTTIRELLATSRQIAESAQRVSRVAEETASGARTGELTVQRAHGAIAGIKLQVDQVVAHMLDLGKKSQQAGGILEIINELSEQTNILAINASIEAAGAGEYGRRFAVVADEIRKLADRVGGSTKEIRGLIEDIRAAVNTTIMATESGTKAVDLGTRQFGEVATAFSRIAGLVGTSTDAAREIELSTKQQATALEQVSTAIVGAAQATRENEASSSQVLQTATALASLSLDLMRLVRDESDAPI